MCVNPLEDNFSLKFKERELKYIDFSCLCMYVNLFTDLIWKLLSEISLQQDIEPNLECAKIKMVKLEHAAQYIYTLVHKASLPHIHVFS